ncbi:HAD-IIIA family hydrolase [Candidatus Gottesmanbacteria bacterium]|nr:HAD-IIIA family hydrolase [Candidatus Gottesmanbacteria bacterium]
MNKAFFLDRDGIIVKMVYDAESGSPHPPLKPSQMEFVPGIFELLKTAKKLGYLNIIISNQPDIGLGRISKNDFDKISEKIRSSLSDKKLTLDAEYYCFHHPFAKLRKYREKCSCRKPLPGLISQAAKDFAVDLKRSWMLGDGVKDVIAGHKAGCKTILLANLHEAEYLKVLEENLKDIKPDYLVKNLKEVITLL